MKLRVAVPVTLVTAFVVGCSDSGPAPDQSIRQLSQALEEGRPQDVLDTFPPRYKADVTGLVHTFGEKMDPEIWDRGFEVVGKVVRVLDEKRDFLLKHPMVAMMTAGADMEEVNTQLDGAVEAYGKIASGPIATVEGLKTIDLEAFLKELLADSSDEIVKTMPEAVEKLGVPWLEGGYETETLSQADGVATIRITPADGSPPTEMQLANVDGYWVSKEIADSWDADIARARAELEEFEIDDEMKAQFAPMMDMVEGILDEMLAAENEVEFGQAVAKAMQLSENF